MNHHGSNIVKTPLHPSMAEDFYSVPFSHETNTSSHTEEAISLMPTIHKVNAAPQEYEEPIRSRGREGPRRGPQHITTSATGQEPDNNYYHI